MRVLTIVISFLVLFASLASAAPMPYASRQLVARGDKSPVSGPAKTPSSTPPPDGTYVISNMVKGPNGEKLAITSNGDGNAATVTFASGSPSQHWIIADSGSGQSMRPVSASGLQAAWGANVVTVLPASNYHWYINKGDNGYSIQDGSGNAYWGAESATDNAKVNIATGTGDFKQTWIFEKVN